MARGWTVAAVAAGAALSVAQVVDQADWGTSGIWEVIMAAPNGVAPPSLAWHHAGTAQGCFYVVGGDGPQGNCSYQYDISANAWSKMPDLPQNFQAPSLTASGGFLALYGGQNSFGSSDTLVALPLGNTSYGWITLTIPGGPGPRSGHRIVSWGGVLFMFGGWDQTQYYNDLWALDLQTYFQSNQTAGWVQLLPGNTPGMPSPRNSFSWDIYSSGIVLYGGFYHSIIPGQPFTQCATPSDGCVWNSDVWFWRPGPTGPNGVVPLTSASGWYQMPATSQSGTLPPGRSWHSTGVLGDQLYVYGGQTATGSAGDMWVFNIPAARWAPVAMAGAWPGPQGTAAAVMIGRHLYMYAGTNFWRFVPMGPAAAATSETISLQDAGLAAGATLTILLNIAILAFTVIMWRRSGPPSLKATAMAVGSAYEHLAPVEI